MEGEVGRTKTVCVTGAGGFVASWLVKRLLSTGEYTVHGTVRDLGDRKTGHLKALEGAGERLRLFKADLLDYATVAYAVAGSGGVFHVASPVPADKPQNPEVEVLAPAVRGTQNVLKACHQAKVGRVVVVSSAAAVAMNPGFPRDAVLDEDAWSDEDYCITNGMWYALSKTLAEREALAHAARTGLDVVTVCPPTQAAWSSSTCSKATPTPWWRTRRGTRWTSGTSPARSSWRTGPRGRPGGTSAARTGRSCLKWSMSSGASAQTLPAPRSNKFVEGEDERMVSSKKLQALGWRFRAAEECLRDSVESYRAAGLLPE